MVLNTGHRSSWLGSFVSRYAERGFKFLLEKVTAARRLPTKDSWRPVGITDTLTTSHFLTSSLDCTRRRYFLNWTSFGLFTRFPERKKIFRSHHVLWLIRVCGDDFQVRKRDANFPVVYRWGPPRTIFPHVLCRWHSHRIVRPKWTTFKDGMATPIWIPNTFSGEAL